MKKCLALDIGGSKLIVALVDESGKVLAQEKTAFSPRPTQEEVLEKILSSTARLPMAGEVVACGATIPGLADPKKGLWVYAPYSGIGNFPIAQLLGERLGLDVYIENDVNACALAEQRWGACREMRDYLWITVSNGVGGALVLNGQLYAGAGGNAGEIGHLTVEDGGPQCPCGKFGCLEACAAGPAIARRYRKAAGLPEGDPIDAAQIAARARAGEPEALAVWRKTGNYLGRAIAAATNLLNLQAAIIGGGVSLSFDLLQEGIAEVYAREAFATANAGMPILQTGLGYEAGLRGAAALAFRGLENQNA